MTSSPARFSVPCSSTVIAIAAIGLVAPPLLANPPAAAPATSPPAEIATGVVFHDRNGNGVRDPGEPGVAGVLVTNSRAVTVTDADGRWSLPAAPPVILSVVQPSGWQVPVDALSLPRHFHIHKPDGSPDAEFVFPGSPPTGPLPASVDFPLRPLAAGGDAGSDDRADGAAPQRFRALLFGDTQPYSLEEVGFVARAVVPQAIAANADFGVSLGDLVGDDLDLFGPLNETIAAIGVPWWNVYGNHDMNAMAPTDEFAAETFHAVYGPTDYAFQRGDATFIVLDDVIWQGFDGWARPGPWTGAGRTDERGFPRVGNYRGGLRPDQIEFVRNLLAHVPREHLVVLCVHIPLEGGGVHRVPEQRELFEALSSHPRTLSVSGHTHYQRHWFFGAEHGYAPVEGTEHHHLNAGAVSGTWWRGARDAEGVPHATMRDGAPNGFWILDVEGSDYTLDFVPARRDPREQMAVHLPPAIDADAPRPFLVNVFAASPRDRVEFRVDGAAWRPMRFDPQIDPAYAALRDAEEATPPQQGRPLRSRPEVAHHIWSAVLPPLPAGGHRLEIRWTDLWGRPFVHAQSLRSVASGAAGGG